jgi:uncharacterized membrane protein
MWFALIGSLALNLAVIGAVGGAMWKWRHGGPAGSSLLFAGERFLRDLPRERRDDLKDIIFRHRELKWQNWRDLRRARNAVASALRANPLDRPLLEKSIAEMQRLELAVREDFLPVFSEVAAALTLEERELFIKSISWRRGGRDGRRGHDHDD